RTVIKFPSVPKSPSARLTVEVMKSPWALVPSPVRSTDRAAAPASSTSGPGRACVTLTVPVPVSLPDTCTALNPGLSDTALSALPAPDVAAIHAVIACPAAVTVLLDVKPCCAVSTRSVPVKVPPVEGTAPTSDAASVTSGSVYPLTDCTTPGTPCSPFSEASHSVSVPANPFATATSYADFPCTAT